VRPEKVRLSKTPPEGTRRNRLKGVVWELGYLGNRSTYQVKTPGGTIVTAFAQNERRTLDWSIDWSDEVYLSWDANAAVLRLGRRSGVLTHRRQPRRRRWPRGRAPR